MRMSLKFFLKNVKIPSNWLEVHLLTCIRVLIKFNYILSMGRILFLCTSFVFFLFCFVFCGLKSPLALME